MDMSKILGIVLIVGVVAVVISFFVSLYNKLIMLKFNVDKAFANIDVLLKQRADEIPNLIKVVKEYQTYEKEVLERLTQLRTQYMNSKALEEKVKIQNEISSGLSKIMMVSENYPDLKADASFQTLQKRVYELEEHLSDRRELFNESVTMYNIGIKEFPALIFARLFGYTPKQLLRISEEEKKYHGIQF